VRSPVSFLAVVLVAVLEAGCGPGAPMQDNVATPEELKSLGPLTKKPELPRKSKGVMVDRIESLKNSVKDPATPASSY
jgi:hypothetical protein